MRLVSQKQKRKEENQATGLKPDGFRPAAFFVQKTERKGSMARRKLRESESLHNGFAEDFAAEIERDTWEKGQQAGRWLSQHLYSEREKREMEQRRRGARAGERKAEAGRPGAKEAEAAQTEAGRGGAAQSTALAAQSVPEGAKKRTPTTGVSAQQNAAWQAAGQDGAGQAPAWLEEFLQMPFASTMDENMAALAQEKTPAQIAREAADAAKARRDSQYRGSGQYGSRGGTGPGDTRTNAQKRAGMLRGEADRAQQRAREADAYAAQLEAEEADAKAALEEKRRAQEQARQAQEEAAARQDPQRKEYWAEQWRSYGRQLDEAKRNGAPQETLYELEAQRGEAYQNYMRLSGQETVARSEQQARQKELEQAQAGQEAQAAQAGQSSGHEAEAAIRQTEQALTDVRLKIADLRAAGAEYAPGGGYSAPFQAALDEEARLESQLDAQQAQAYQQAQASVNWGMLMEWASSDYEMTDAQKTVATELVEQWNGTIGPKFDEYYETAQRLHALGQSTETVEMLLLQAEIMDTLATKVSGVRSAFSGAGNALPLVPQIRGALEAENWRRAGFEGENPLGLAQRSQGAAMQNPLAYHAGYLASGMGQYAAGSAAMKALPGVGGFLDDAAGALAGTQAAQKLQTVPVLGRLGTQQALAGMLGDSMLDLGLSTIPKGVGLELEYARQQREGLRPGETPLTQSGIFLQLAADAGLNAASGALGELAPAALGALDDLWNGRPVLNAAQQQGFEALRQGAAPSANQQAALHSLWEKAPGYVPAHRGGWDEFPSAPAAAGAAQDAGEAAQRQAFLKWTQGEAMTAQEKAFVEDLWNTDPAKASEYWAAGEFLSTEVPTSSALDGGHLDDTIKTETTAPDSEGLHFDNLQDGIRWEGIIRSVEGGEEVWRSPDIEVRFRRNINLSKAEFERQLYDQQTAINRLTVAEYLENRRNFLKHGRASAYTSVQKTARENACLEKIQELRKQGFSLEEAKEQAHRWMGTQAVLHNPDQVAGGYAQNIGGLGDSTVNSSIGAQWKYRIKDVDKQMQLLLENFSMEELQSVYLNVKLTIY